MRILHQSHDSSPSTVVFAGMAEAVGQLHRRVAAALASAGQVVWAWLRHAWQGGVTVDGLEGLDDHTLRDIGMHRHQIESEVRYRDRCQW